VRSFADCGTTIVLVAELSPTVSGPEAEPPWTAGPIPTTAAAAVPAARRRRVAVTA
jgi:hypothetical protein